MKRELENSFSKNAVFVFCEWETEKQYFECFWSIQRITVHTHVVWEVNVNNIKSQITNIWNHLKSKYKFNKRELKKYWLKIYYLVDCDTIQNKKDIELIKEMFEKESIFVLFSNKDFELFILEHFVYYNKEDWNYIDEIKKYEPEYTKWMNLKTKRIFLKIINERLDDLITNIEKLKKYHEKLNHNNIKEKNPFSEVIDVINYCLRKF